MRKYKKYLLPPAIILAAIIFVVILAANRPKPPAREPVVTAMLVDIIEAQSSQGFFEVQAQGVVRPRTETTVSAEVGGRLIEVSDQFVAGGFFRAGDVLARIDPSDYEAQYLQAQAELAGAEATLADERARSQQAERDWERIHGSDRQPNDLVLRIPQVQRAQAQVDAAKAAVLRATRNLERTEIKLPYDGMVRARNVDLGQYINPGLALGVTFAIDVAEVRLPLSNQDKAFLDLPPPGEVSMDGPIAHLRAEVDGEWGQWMGRVVRTEGVIDERTRLSYAVVAIDDPYHRLTDAEGEGPQRAVLPMGTFVEATIEGQSATGLIRLPRAALRSGDRIFVADGDDELDIRDVDVVRATTEEVYVGEGIKPGDRVIITGITAPIPGSKLRIKGEPAPGTPRQTPTPDAEVSSS